MADSSRKKRNKWTLSWNCSVCSAVSKVKYKLSSLWNIQRSQIRTRSPKSFKNGSSMTTDEDWMIQLKALEHVDCFVNCFFQGQNTCRFFKMKCTLRKPTYRYCPWKAHTSPKLIIMLNPIKGRLLQTDRQQLVSVMSVTHYAAPHLPPVSHSTSTPISLSLCLITFLISGVMDSYGRYWRTETKQRSILN